MHRALRLIWILDEEGTGDEFVIASSLLLILRHTTPTQVYNYYRITALVRFHHWHRPKMVR